MTAHLINVAELETFFKFNAAITVVDVRKKPAVESEPAMIKGAVWHAHDAVDIWADDLPNDVVVICYCVHGHAVSQSAVAALRAKGRDAYYLRGGLEAWLHASGPIRL
jgi:rhodanese-related sulfurtransferase